jgi:hypothetical protein
MEFAVMQFSLLRIGQQGSGIVGHFTEWEIMANVSVASAGQSV